MLHMSARASEYMDENMRMCQALSAAAAAVTICMNLSGMREYQIYFLANSAIDGRISAIDALLIGLNKRPLLSSENFPFSS